MMFQTEIQDNCFANCLLLCYIKGSRNLTLKCNHLLVKQGRKQQQVQHKKEENYLDKTAGKMSIGSVTLKTGSEQN